MLSPNWTCWIVSSPDNIQNTRWPLPLQASAIWSIRGSEICQHVIGQVLEGWHNVRNFADNILIHGTTTEDHDRSPENVLLCPQEKSLTVHPTKYLFGIMELDYYGSHLSTRGIPRQGSYTRKQAHAAAQHSHGSKKLSGISKHCRLFPSIPSCNDRADTKDHTQRLSMVIGPRAIWSL